MIFKSWWSKSGQPALFRQKPNYDHQYKNPRTVVALGFEY